MWCPEWAPPDSPAQLAVYGRKLVRACITLSGEESSFTHNVCLLFPRWPPSHLRGPHSWLVGAPRTRTTTCVPWSPERFLGCSRTCWCVQLRRVYMPTVPAQLDSRAHASVCKLTKLGPVLEDACCCLEICRFRDLEPGFMRLAPQRIVLLFLPVSVERRQLSSPLTRAFACTNRSCCWGTWWTRPTSHPRWS